MGKHQVNKKYCLIGGAGMIGSYFTDALLNDPNTTKLTIYDNFSSSKNREWHYEYHLNDGRLKVIIGNVEDTTTLTSAMRDHDVVIHLASNADISRATTDPSVDFWQGTALTNLVLESMRINNIKRLLYASGSGVYGDTDQECAEYQGSLLPISPYGASKLASEVLIHSYCKMFGMSACAFRFGNVVSARQTHGVSLDFTKKLLSNPHELTILGNGSQSKSYIDAGDVVRAVLLANEKLNSSFEIYNVATGDYITVKEIAELTAECLGLNDVKFTYGKGNKGWAGDVNMVRLNTNRIKSLGWNCSMGSREALQKAVMEMVPHIKSGKIS